MVNGVGAGEDRERCRGGGAVLRVRETGATSRAASRSRGSASAPSSRSLAFCYWYVQIVRGDYYYDALGEQPDPLGQDHGAPRLRPRPQRLGPGRERARLHLQLYRREAKDLGRLVDFAVEVLQLPPRAGARRAWSAALRYPEFVPIPIAENLGSRGGRRDRGARARASGVRDRGLAAAPLHAWRRRRRTSSATSPRRRRIRSGRLPDALPRSATGSARRASRRTYETLLAGINGERRVVVDSHGREISRGEPARGAARPEPLRDDRPRASSAIAEEYFARQGRRRGRARPEARARSSPSSPRRPTIRTGSRGA